MQCHGSLLQHLTKALRLTPRATSYFTG